MSIRRGSLTSAIRFESFLLLAITFGCGSSTSNSPVTGAGGSITGNTGGATASTGGAATVTTGGSVTVATGGRVTAATGGSITVATGGRIGAATGGAETDATGGDSSAAIGGDGALATGGAATTSGTGGSTSLDCNPPVVTKCTGSVPPAALISDFSIATGATAPQIFGTWSQSVYGGTFAYPSATATSCATPSAYPIASAVSGGTWNITGTVGTYSGFGLWWSCDTGTGTTAAPAYAGSCVIDASAYTGISFTISGNAGPASGTATTGSVGLAVQSASTLKPKTDSAGNAANCGTCSATTCGSTVTVPVTATSSIVKFTWAQLGITDPNAIAAIGFQLTDPCGLNNGYATTPCTPTSFAVNIAIDNLQFTTN